MSHRPSKLDDLIYFNVTSSSSSNSNHNSNAFSDDGVGAMPDERNFLRPGTARSLPTPYTTHGAVDPATGAATADYDDNDKASLMSSRYLNVSSDYNGNGNRPRNLSYPSLNSLPPTPNPSPVRVINVVSSSSTTTSASGRSTMMAFDDPDLNNRVDDSSHPPPSPHRNSSKQNSKKSSSRVPTPVPPISPPVNVSGGGNGGESSMPVSPKNIVLSGNGSASGKSNLDYFLDYSRNPFTTKYEIVGNSKGTLD